MSSEVAHKHHVDFHPQSGRQEGGKPVTRSAVTKRSGFSWIDSEKYGFMLNERLNPAPSGYFRIHDRMGGGRILLSPEMIEKDG